jgi:hypothetical protein
VQPPDAIPQWVPCAGYSGLIAYTIKENGAVASSASVPNSANGATYLAVRTSVFADGPAPRFAVILDLPLNEQTVSRLRAETGITLLGVTASTRYAAPQRARPDARTIQLGQTAGNERFELPWVVFTGFADWETGRLGNATVSIGMSIREIYDRLSPSWRGQVVGGTFREGVIILVLIVGVLFLLIQFVAWWSAWRWPDRSPDRYTSSSSARIASSTETSRIGSRSRPAISSASSPTPSIR